MRPRNASAVSPTALAPSARSMAASYFSVMVLTASKQMALYFEAVVAKAGKDNAKAAANWLMGDVSSTLNREGVEIDNAPVEASQLAVLLKRIADGTISNKIAKEVFAAMWEAKSNDEHIADAIIEGRANAVQDVVNAVAAEGADEFVEVQEASA